MRVGIVTKIGKNYGAVLQAFALKRACERLGARTRIIKFAPELSRKSYDVCKFPWTRLGGARENAKALLRRREIATASRRFLKFRDETFDFLGDYENDAQFQARPPKLDVYLVGSDQVWNPRIAFDETFYLTGIDANEGRLASYAASVGVREIPETIRDEFKRRVERFHFVSVREKSARTLLREMGIEAEIAPDPTTLFSQNEWREEAAPENAVRGKYILCYFVSTPPNARAIVKKIQKRFGYPVVNLATSETSSAIGDVKIRDAGPREFLRLFADAELTITSSFHGTVFSLIERKPFVSILGENANDRVVELLENVGLSERILRGRDDDFSKCDDVEIYSPSVEAKIDALRAQGFAALKRALQID